MFQQTQLAVTVPVGSTIQQVIELSKILVHCPNIDLTTQSVGIFNKVSPLDHRVREGDRVEIYESLKIDPKDARRIRVKNTQTAK